MIHFISIIVSDEARFLAGKEKKEVQKGDIGFLSGLLKYCIFGDIRKKRTAKYA